MKPSSSRLSWELLKSVLSIYFVITLVVTVSQMAIEYEHTRGMIQSELASTEKTFYPALATALWELNTEQLQAIQRGMVALPIISSVRVVDTAGHTLAGVEKPGAFHPLGTSITHRFPVTYRFSGEDIHLADVVFESSSGVVLDRVEMGYRMILVSALIKSAALTLLFFWVFRRQLAIPLKQLSDAVESIDIESLGQKQLDLKQSADNELSKFERAFNRMLGRLDDERRTHEATLTAMNRDLEMLVEKRTEELKAANADLERLVRTDTLTGVANRRHFVERMNGEIQRARRTGAPVCMLMLDLDHFKRVNDTWGHSVGDEVLRSFAAIAAAHLRAGDLFARLGGEEFAILLPDTDLTGAEEVARRILTSIREHRIRCDEGEIHYTVSIGAAMLLEVESDYEPLLKRADSALYLAKEHGRDRVEVCACRLH